MLGEAETHTSNVAVARKDRRRPDVDDQTKFYANRMRVYPKAVHGPARTFKWLAPVGPCSWDQNHNGRAVGRRVRYE
jgi:hypothetical protein